MIARTIRPLSATTLFVVAILALCLGLGVDQRNAHAQAGTILRVNAANNEDAGNDGSSWDKAYVKLQDAFGAANSGAQIWVAKGVYYPDEGVGKTNNDFNHRFELESGVEIYGGFAGTETQLSQRNSTLNVTVLSGDIENNDTDGAGGILSTAAEIVDNNSTNVVYGSGVVAARLDGFVITGGAATRDGAFCANGACGGGLFVVDSSVTLANLTFSGNRGWYGGGAIFYATSPATVSLTNILFTGNLAKGFGAGLIVQEGVVANLKQVQFVDNSSEGQGGAATFRLNSTVNMEDVTFTGNQSKSLGGAIYAAENATVTIKTATFTRNGTTVDGQGGAIYQSGGTLKISNTEISRNRAWSLGGGVSITGVNATLSNVKFLGNFVAVLSETAYGGDMAVEGGSLATANVLFSGNHSDDAGALYLKDITTTLRHVTIAEQEAPAADSEPFAAHGILVDGGSVTIQNSIVWAQGQKAIALINSGGYFGGNTVFAGPDTPMNGFGIMSVSASPFRSLPSPSANGYGDNPNTLDVDESDNDNYGDLRLNGTTAVIDKGNNANTPADALDLDGDDNTTEPLPIDLAGGTRLLRMTAATAIVDPGAYEYANAAPNAIIPNSHSLDEGGSIELDATGSTDDAAIASYQWDCTNNNSTDVTEDSPTQGLCVYPNSGLYTLRLTVTDALNATGTATKTVTVNNIAPTFTPPANQSATTGITTTLTLGSFTDPGAEGTWSVSVNWGDNTTPTQFIVSSAGALPNKAHSYAAQGSCEVSVTVTDDAASANGSFQVQMGAAPSGAPCFSPPTSQQATAGIENLFTLGSFAHANRSGPWQITINWGDGSPETQFEATSAGVLPSKPHTYAQGGSYEVLVTVSDGTTSSNISFQVTIPAQEGGTIFLPNARK